MHDLNVLSTQGVTVMVHGTKKTFLDALATFSGDNLSVHSIASFQTYFHCNRVCHVYMISYEDTAKYFTEEGITIHQILGVKV